MIDSYMVSDMNKDKEEFVYRTILKQQVTKLLDETNPTIVSIRSNDLRA